MRLRTLCLSLAVCVLATLSAVVAAPGGVPKTEAAGIVKIATGGFHSCVLTSAGSVQCWGLNNVGQIGDGTTCCGPPDAPSRATPTDVVNLSGVTDIDAGGTGYGSGNQPDPFPEAHFLEPAQGHTCAVTAPTGGVKCWGTSQFGQLGNGVQGAGNISAAPADVCAPGAAPPCTPANGNVLRGAEKISAGVWHTCALMFGGTVTCWGKTYVLGIGGNSSGNTPAPVYVCATGATAPCSPAAGNALTGVTQVVTGFDQTCALITGGEVKCWGYNLSEAIGVDQDCNTPTPCTTPRDVCAVGATPPCTPANGNVLTSIVQIAAGNNHTCALNDSNLVLCWGNDFAGQLGDHRDCTEFLDSDCGIPQPVCDDFFCNGTLSDAVSITAGSTHTCALLQSGAVKCWGVNEYGELGTGHAGDGDPVTVDSYYAPEFVCQTGAAGPCSPEDGDALTGVATAELGAFHACFLSPANGITCSGLNRFGELGTVTAGTCGEDHWACVTTPVGVTGFSPKINTPVGANVPVNLGSGVTVTFDSVKEAGVTSMTTSNTGPPPPAGFQIPFMKEPVPDFYFDISTTAVFNPYAHVCVTYDDSMMTGLLQEGSLRLLHYEGGAWQIVTTDPSQIDVDNNVICGRVSSFSLILLAEIPPPGEQDPGILLGRLTDALNAHDGGGAAELFHEDGILTDLSSRSFAAVGLPAIALILSDTTDDSELVITLVTSEGFADTVRGVLHVKSSAAKEAGIERYVQPYQAVVKDGKIVSLDLRYDETDEETRAFLKYLASLPPDDSPPPPDRTSVNMAGNQNGTASLGTRAEGVVLISINVSEGPDAVLQPASIYSGSCDALGTVASPLAVLVNSNSYTYVSGNLKDWLSGQYAIAIGASPDSPDVIVSCGNVAPSPADGVTQLPITGDSTANTGSDGVSWPLTALLALSGAAAVTFGALSVRPRGR